MKANNRFLRAALGLLAVGGFFLPESKDRGQGTTSVFHPRKVYPTVQVRNSVTGKIVNVPEHNVEYFLSRRTDRWSVI